MNRVWQTVLIRILQTSVSRLYWPVIDTQLSILIRCTYFHRLYVLSIVLSVTNKFPMHIFSPYFPKIKLNCVNNYYNEL